MGSVRLLFRFGVAVEKLGKHIAKIGGGRQIHPQSSRDLSFSQPAEIIRDLNQSYSGYTVKNVALGNEVNKNSGIATVKNIDLLATQINRAGFSHNHPLLDQSNAFAH